MNNLEAEMRTEIEGCEILLSMKGQPTEIQFTKKSEINAAFKKLLSANPTEAEFNYYMGNVILTPSMLWSILNHPPIY